MGISLTGTSLLARYLYTSGGDLSIFWDNIFSRGYSSFTNLFSSIYGGFKDAFDKVNRLYGYFFGREETQQQPPISGAISAFGINESEEEKKEYVQTLMFETNMPLDKKIEGLLDYELTLAYNNSTLKLIESAKNFCIR